jgi:electron transfer flavoprotein alpha subunit
MLAAVLGRGARRGVAVSLSCSSWAAQRTAAASTLVVSDPLVAGAVPPATLSVITAAQQLGDESVTLLTDGVPSGPVPDCISSILVGGGKTAESVAAAVHSVAKEHSYSHVLTSASKFGSNFAPRLAALLDVSPVTDVIQILSEGTVLYFITPII